MHVYMYVGDFARPNPFPKLDQTLKGGCVGAGGGFGSDKSREPHLGAFL